jgi:transcriptional regulator with XRE-family HTH domain
MEDNQKESIKYAVAKNIRIFREARGLTQKELAEKFGVVEGTVSNYEKGVSSPDIVKLFMICEILGVLPSVMFGMTDESKVEAAYRKLGPRSRQAIDILLEEQKK